MVESVLNRIYKRSQKSTFILITQWTTQAGRFPKALKFYKLSGLGGHKLESSAGLLNKTISTRDSINRSLSPPSVRVEARGAVEAWTVEHDRQSVLLFYV